LAVQGRDLGQASLIAHTTNQRLEIKNLLGIVEELSQPIHGRACKGSPRRSSSALIWESTTRHLPALTRRIHVAYSVIEEIVEGFVEGYFAISLANFNSDV
jgi:hypothetical protein